MGPQLAYRADGSAAAPETIKHAPQTQTRIRIFPRTAGRLGRNAKTDFMSEISEASTGGFGRIGFDKVLAHRNGPPQERLTERAAGAFVRRILSMGRANLDWGRLYPPALLHSAPLRMR